MTRLGIATLLTFAAVSCARQPAYRPKFVLVFVDTSASVKDFSTFDEAWSRIVERLDVGDRVVLAPISDQTYTRFRPVADVEIPRFNWVSENRLTYEKLVSDRRRRLSEAYATLSQRPKAANTRIFDTFVLADKVFGKDDRRRVMIILSDMLEDSDEYNFEKIHVSSQFVKKVLARASAQRGLPDLSSVQVYVAGASASTESRAADVEDFWVNYVKRCSGDLQRRNYGPSLMNFDR